MRGKTTIYAVLAAASLLLVSGSALAQGINPDDVVAQVPISASVTAASNEVENEHLREARNLNGVADASCQWTLLLNSLTLSAVESDSLAVAGSTILEGVDLDDIFGNQRPGHGGMPVGGLLNENGGYEDDVGSGKARCDTVIRNFKVHATLADGFGLPPPTDLDGFSSFLGTGVSGAGGAASADDLVVQVPIAIGISAAKNDVGNFAKDDYRNSDGSAFSRCQWFLGVNVVTVALGSSSAAALAESDIGRQGDVVIGGNGGLGASGGSYKPTDFHTADSMCSTVIDNFELDLDMDTRGGGTGSF